MNSRLSFECIPFMKIRMVPLSGGSTRSYGKFPFAGMILLISGDKKILGARNRRYRTVNQRWWVGRVYSGDRDNHR